MPPPSFKKYLAALFRGLFPPGNRNSRRFYPTRTRFPLPANNRSDKAPPPRNNSFIHGEAREQAGRFVRPRRHPGRRLRARRAGRARPHLSLRLHRRLRRHGRRVRREARRGYADGDAGGGGYRARAGRRRPGDGRVPHLRRPPEPRRDGGAHGARPHHQAPGGALRRRAAARVLPRLHPPPLPQRRHGDPGARPGRWHQPDAGPGDGGDPHLLPAVRHLRHDPGPTEPGPHHRPAADGPHRRRQQPRRRQLHRRIHEPGSVLRASPGHWGLDKPLGLLDRPAARRAPGRLRVRVAVHCEQDARAAAQWRHLTNHRPAPVGSQHGSCLFL